jgi:tetratricopeptide (TPR) repeat protein
VLARLQREWQLLEDATDHVVLGISPGMSEEVVRQACQRMSRRYKRLAAQSELEPEARELARQIHQRVRTAIERVRAGTTKTEIPNPFEQGQAAIRAGKWEIALKYFVLARKQDDDPRNLAWFGWAMYNDLSRPKDRRQDKGREHMELAESMSVNSPDAAFLLARADLQEGQLMQAATRLNRLIRQFPEHDGARQLLVQVQKDIQP